MGYRRFEYRFGWSDCPYSIQPVHFCWLAFIIVHLYLITTGTTVTSNLKAMITGYEELETGETDNNKKTVPENVTEIINSEVVDE